MAQMVRSSPTTKTTTCFTTGQEMARWSMKNSQSLPLYTPITNIPTSGTAGGETFGALYLGNNRFYHFQHQQQFPVHDHRGRYSGTHPSRLVSRRLAWPCDATLFYLSSTTPSASGIRLPGPWAMRHLPGTQQFIIGATELQARLCSQLDQRHTCTLPLATLPLMPCSKTTP
jgi:hypothetical protein